MPRDGAMTIWAIEERGLDRIAISCRKCGRAGVYGIASAVARWGRDAKLTDVLHDVTADCPKRSSVAIFDRCEAKFDGLAREPIPG